MTEVDVVLYRRGAPVEFTVGLGTSPEPWTNISLVCRVTDRSKINKVVWASVMEYTRIEDENVGTVRTSRPPPPPGSYVLRVTNNDETVAVGTLTVE